MTKIANNTRTQNKAQGAPFLTNNIIHAAGGEKCPVCGVSVDNREEYCRSCGVMLNPYAMNELPGEISVTGDTSRSAEFTAVNSAPSFTDENTDLAAVAAADNSAPAFCAPVTNRGAKMPKNLLDKSSETTICIAFDWLELTGKKQDLFLANNTKNGQFLFEVEDTENSDIKQVNTCYRGTWESMGKLWVGMRNGYVRPDWCKLKLENHMCYTPGKELRAMIEQFFEWAGITFRHFARLDVAADFQRCDYRGGLNPQLFMERVAKRRYVFKGKGVKTINKPANSAPFSQLEGQDVSEDNVEIYGRLGRVETIRVGSRKSGLSISMYNKSAEMRAKIDKPYIRESWKIAGMAENVDTFRVEFQATKTPKGIFLVSPDGELEANLTHASLDILEHLETYYRCLWLHHFRVAIYEQGQRFSRMKAVELFNVDRHLYLIERYSDKQKNNNYVKAGLKAWIQDALKLQAAGSKMMASEMFKYVRLKLDKHDLHKWFDKQFPGLFIEDSIITYRDLLTNKEAHRGGLVQGSVILNDQRKRSFEMMLS